MTNEPGAGDRRPVTRPPVEWVDLGEIGHGDGSGPQDVVGDALPGTAPAPGRRPPRLAVLVVLVILGLAFGATLLRDQHDGSPAASARPPGPSVSATTSPAPTSEPETGPDSAEAGPPPQVRQVSPHLLGITAQDWDLVARGPGVVVRIQPAAGRITLTRLPELASSGPVAFVPVTAGVVVRPWDSVPGYVVPDEQGWRRLHGLLAGGGVVLPGPDPDHVWVDTGDQRRTSVVLSDLTGAPAGSRVVVPSTALGPVTPDGAGYVLFAGIGGTYDARPDRVERVTAGTAVAVGAERVVAVECDDQYRCSTVVLGLTDGSRRVIAAGFPPTYSLGAVSPDGRLAAVPEQRGDSQLGLQLFDLVSGRATRAAVNLDRNDGDSAVVWAPDSSWVFALDDAGSIRAIDPHTGRSRGLGVALPPVSQLAVRGPLPSTG